MTITLVKATPEDANALHALQIKSFLPLLEKYKDFETSPAITWLKFFVSSFQAEFVACFKEFFLVKFIF